MSEVTYEIVEHDGGWAYKVDGVFSEPFPTHAAALAAAQAAAAEQGSPATPSRSSSRTRKASGTQKLRAAATARRPTSRIRTKAAAARGAPMNQTDIIASPKLRAAFFLGAGDMLAVWGWSLFPAIESRNNPNEDGFSSSPPSTERSRFFRSE